MVPQIVPYNFAYYYIDDVSVVGDPSPPPPPPVIDGCLKDSKVAVKCNPDGSYTLTLSGSSFAGTDITLTSQTAGVTVTPPQQPWAATTTWTITGATAGQSVVLTATGTKAGGGSAEGTDQCCVSEIKLVMPECVDVKIGKENTPGGGSGQWFNVWVTNVGSPITFSAGDITITENIPSGMTVTGVTGAGWSCVPPTMVGPGPMNCTYNLAGSLGTNVSISSTMFVHYTTTGPGPFTNCATVAIGAAVGLDSNPSNDTACVTVTPTPGSLIVEKKVIYAGPIPLPSLTYPVTVTCDGTVTNLGLVNGIPQTVNNIPVGTGCTVVEGTVPTPAGVCPPPTVPTWSTAYVPPSPITITGIGTKMTIENTMTCGPPKICPPGTVLVGTECMKTPVCRPPMIMNAAGACVCGPGYTLRGKECVKTIDCRPPLMPNAAGTDCVCKKGLILRGGKCVEPLVCKEHASPNRAGTACLCDKGYEMRRGVCIKERERITPDDIIRNIPFPGSGGGGRNPRGGGDPPGGGSGTGPVKR